MRVTAIIPAYNEESRIEKVIVPILETDIVSNIIVVDDGSQDSTSNIVSKYNVNLVKMSKNRGKAEAIKKGIKCCEGESDIIVLLDADLVGLTSNHIRALVLPILEKDVDMTIGIFKSGRYITDLAQSIAPNLSGQRAIKSRVAYEIVDMEVEGYCIEAAFSQLIKKYNLNVENVILKNVTHVIKEEKVGFIKGISWRLQMYKDIIRYLIH
ncbi:MAG: glycosyltransferase family 2 protein [Clostridiales bacterium]|nr:glycosyltransferase family 2 protein [Clostridiales bacterium]